MTAETYERVMSAPDPGDRLAYGCNNCDAYLTPRQLEENPALEHDWEDLGDDGVVCPDCFLGGRGLDAQIAERVTGKTVPHEWMRVPRFPNLFECCNCQVLQDDAGPFCLDYVPRYSENIAAAWEVVEKLAAAGWILDLLGPVDNAAAPEAGPKVLVAFETLHPGNGDFLCYRVEEAWDQVPRAICRAALQVAAAGGLSP
jgi:hypothetical protein